MDDIPGLLSRDFGFRSQGKSAPMSASKGPTTSSSGTLNNFGTGSSGEGRSSSFSTSSNRAKPSWNSNQPVQKSSFLDEDNLFRSSSQKNQNHDFDVFGGPPKYTTTSSSNQSDTSFNYDFKSASSLPVFDKPVYDDDDVDIFVGVPGMKSTASVNYDDVFASYSSPPKGGNNDHYADLLGNSRKNDSKSSFPKEDVKKDEADFGDLLPGFGGSTPHPPPKKRGTPDISQPHQPKVPPKSMGVLEEPFVIIEPGSVPAYESSESFSDPLEQFNKPSKPENTHFDSSSGTGVFEDMDSLDDLAKSVPSSGVKPRVEEKKPVWTGANATSTRRASGEEPTEEPFFRTAKSASPKVVSPKAGVSVDSVDDIWITVSEVPLFTQPTSAPPPSRPPPPRPVQVSKADSGSLSARNAKEKVNEFSSYQHFSPSFQSPTTVPSSGGSMGVSSVDELEDFAMGKSRDNNDDRADVLSSEEELDTNSAAAASAAAMKEAMDRAEAKFKHAKEVRERESVRTGRSREAAQQEKDEKDEKALRDAQEQGLREKQERLDREREQREREEKERERRRLEKERERTRLVVERATREARERAAAEARQKAQKEARERSDRAAVQRAQAEARERAATDARERAERAASEAKERSNIEARERANAVTRAATEVRLRAERASAERAAAEARERAAAAAREHQQHNENDLESFFGMGARASSAPRPRTTTSDSPFDSQFQNKPAPEASRRTSSGTSSTIRKASSTTNIVDDLTSIFGGVPSSSSGEFQEIDGETEERRRARLERHQRTQQRAAKALAEKNERDLQTQRDQAERHNFADTLDTEIKRWSAGKEGNLRALLSTLQYVLWPECGWQPVSLTDLITAAAVKKVYRKATLCIHPDKVQQKGANLQQKYIAEKVFDLLKEAWNKFNSEELF